MVSLFLLFAALIGVGVSGQGVFTPTDNVWPVPDVWPLPKSFSLGDSNVYLDIDNFALMMEFEGDDQSQAAYIGKAFQNFTDKFKLQWQPYVPSIWGNEMYPNYTKPVFSDTRLSGIVVSVNKSVPLEFGVDESYSLVVPVGPLAELTAQTVWGALHGLETFFQLAMFKLTDAVDTMNPQGAFFVANCPILIDDAPRFAWRGLLVDVSRHFLSAAFLHHVVDSMAMNKLNVMHLHISDAESFPFASQSVPEMVRGAYSPNATFSTSDLETLVAYGTTKGVRIVPELDTPGHTASWEKAVPGINVDCWNYLRNSYSSFIRWPSWDSIGLCLTNPKAKEVTSKLISELSSVFPDPFFHLGGDEVITKCFLQDDRILNELDNRGLNRTADGLKVLQNEWEVWVTDFTANSTKKRPIVWEEAFVASQGGQALNPNTVVNVWSVPAVAKDAIQAGHNVISSFGWYLDRQAPTCTSSTLCPVNWLFMYTWQDMYKFDPIASVAGWIPSPQEEKMFLGGELSSWGESCSEVNFDERVWSRGPAAAERLWSPQNVTSIPRAQERFASWHCKMRQRGVTCSSTQPGYCPLPSSAAPPPTDCGDLVASSYKGATVALGVLLGTTILGGSLAFLKFGAGAAVAATKVPLTQGVNV